jgi:hypothetical protein
LLLTTFTSLYRSVANLLLPRLADCGGIESRVSTADHKNSRRFGCHYLSHGRTKRGIATTRTLCLDGAVIKVATRRETYRMPFVQTSLCSLSRRKRLGPKFPPAILRQMVFKRETAICLALVQSDAEGGRDSAWPRSTKRICSARKQDVHL